MLRRKKCRGLQVLAQTHVEMATHKTIIEQAVIKEIITQEEANLIFAAEDARTIAISVDYFNPGQLTGHHS